MKDPINPDRFTQTDVASQPFRLAPASRDRLAVCSDCGGGSTYPSFVAISSLDSLLKHFIDRNNLNLLRIEIQLVAFDYLVFIQNLFRRR